MRTTITIDNDLAEVVKSYMTKNRLSLKDAINQLLESALISTGLLKSEELNLKTSKMGVKKGLSLQNIAELEEELDRG